jgi:uncharacterized glyoxalase superfamily protein PhnB
MLRVSLLTVLVDDQDAAMAFYRERLGFVLAEDLPFGDQRWVTLRAPDDSTLSISLNLAKSPAEKALVGRQTGSTPLFAIDTDDCLRDYRRMKAAGVKFDGEPTVQPYGTGVTLQDLYGNRIYMNQEPVAARRS